MNFKQKMARLAVIAAASAGSVSAFAVDNGFDTAMAAIDLTSIGTKVGAAVLLIIGVAIAFKGGDMAKRVIRKV